jgi:hypothetical protein
LLRFLSHAASVDENKVRLGRVIHLPAPPGGKNLGDPLGIIDIHLASEGLNEKVSGSHHLFHYHPSSPTCQFSGSFSHSQRMLLWASQSTIIERLSLKRCLKPGQI